MLAKRVIPCLDVHNGRTTRGQQFGRAERGELLDVGDPVALALRYNDQGADELVFYDITATSEGRSAMLDIITRTAEQCRLRAVHVHVTHRPAPHTATVSRSFVGLEAGEDLVGCASGAVDPVVEDDDPLLVIAAGFGRVVLVSSRAALGLATRTAYSATKAGMIGMARTWALELAPHGITVNVVAPGPIAETEMFHSVVPQGSAREAALAAAIPVGRLGHPDDVADAVMFFAGHGSGFVTGQTLYVCGGASIGSVAI